MLQTVVDVCVPVLVFTAMFVVGMELTTDEFRRIGRQPRIVVAATVGQFCALPVIAWILATCPRLQPAIAQGMLLVAAFPGGATANVYTFLARSNAALSVPLTTVSCLASLAVTPLLLAFFQTGGEDPNRLSVPLGVLAAQLIVLLILPVFGGGDVDYLVIDVCLPGMGGLELLEQVNAKGPARAMAVVITSHDDERIRNRAVAAGAIGFFLKPFDNRELQAAVSQTLGLTQK